MAPDRLSNRPLQSTQGQPVVATYSIVACDLEAGQWGVAVQSATQAYANPRYGPEGLALLREGKSAREALDALTAGDDGRDERQVGIVDGRGRAATFSGSGCHEWAGGRTGDCYAAQGNILVSEETVDALATTFEGNGHLSLAERLIECLAAAQAAGGDRRGQQSASLLVVEQDGGYAKLSDIVVDLRVDDHERPIAELRRLYVLHQELFGVTPEEDWVEVDDALADELRTRLDRLGFAGDLRRAFADWAGKENLEERVDGIERIDPVVLEALRKASA
ncbi:MAG: DUF1028 domain-containing protein [Actinobacteria bacterium]|nr:MAG: DUF1028 domain-containing protein [Actinomycetota bacterium]